MDVKELQKRRVELERKIALQVADLVEQFRQETGISVENVSVDMVRVTAASDLQNRPLNPGCLLWLAFITFSLCITCGTGYHISLEPSSK